MKVTKLNLADIFRDGGSYTASFETDDGLTYNIFLQRSKMPDGDGLHHRWLFEYFGTERPRGCLPVVTGSQEEKALLDRLKDFSRSCALGLASSSEQKSLDRLTELAHYIERREPCLPSDLTAWRLEAE